MFIGKYDKSVIVTYLGTLFAMTGIYLTLGFEEPKLTFAIICLVLAGVCDMFDGKVARMIKGRTEEDKQYGIQIDSLADMVSFIVFPVVLLYGMAKYFNIGICGYVAVPVLTLFTVAGISRLAFFNINASKEDGPVKHYTGLPVTTTSMIFPLVYMLRYVLNPEVFVSIYLAMFAIIAFLMVFNFKIKKPKGNIWYVACSIIAIVAIAVLLILKAHH